MSGSSECAARANGGLLAELESRIHEARMRAALAADQEW